MCAPCLTSACLAIETNLGGTTVVSQLLGSEGSRHIQQTRTSAILAAASPLWWSVGHLRQVLLESDPVQSGDRLSMLGEFVECPQLVNQGVLDLSLARHTFSRRWRRCQSSH